MTIAMNVDMEPKPTRRRYTAEQKESAVRMVFALRDELGTEAGRAQRVAEQLGYGVESVRLWVKQADIDRGTRPGTSSAEAEENKRLRQENRELKRANEILKRAAHFFGAELDREQKRLSPSLTTIARSPASSRSAKFCSSFRPPTAQPRPGHYRNGRSTTRCGSRS